MSVSIRKATPADMGQVHGLIRELAEFEGGTVKSTPDDLARDYGRFEVLLAERDGAAVGMLVFFATYSTWEGRPGTMIHDLFVREAGRGAGIGKALVKEVARLTVERGGTRLDVNVLDWNDKARGFYAGCGLSHDGGWLRYRVDGDGLLRLAAG